MNDAPPAKRPAARGFFRALGPAIIVASVVIGPGSILTNSKVGAQNGYSMVWLLVCAAALMAGTTALAARLGVSFERTLCDELAHRAGRWLAVLAGGAIFVVASCFQFGNNLGVLAAIEPFLEPAGDAAAAKETAAAWAWWPAAALFVLNGAVIAVLLGLKRLYAPIETLMMVLVMMMLAAFAANLIFAKPSLFGIARGLVPSLPARTDPKLPLWEVFVPLFSLFGTTFSVAGAFYQGYLVREKGWTLDNLAQGLLDSVAGIVVLGGISLMVMTTSAAVFFGTPQAGQINSLADIAQQLGPLFGGRLATILFALGVFAGAFSSFLVNAMIGGSMLSDGLGLGGKMDQPWPKVFTVVALLMGMIVAIGVKVAGMSTVNLIIFAQAVTVIAVPVLALSMLFLSLQPDLTGPRRMPRWLIVVAALACVTTLVMASSTLYQLSQRIWPPQEKAAAIVIHPAEGRPGIH